MWLTATETMSDSSGCEREGRFIGLGFASPWLFDLTTFFSLDFGRATGYSFSWLKHTQKSWLFILLTLFFLNRKLFPKTKHFCTRVFVKYRYRFLCAYVPIPVLADGFFFPVIMAVSSSYGSGYSFVSGPRRRSNTYRYGSRTLNRTFPTSLISNELTWANVFFFLSKTELLQLCKNCIGIKKLFLFFSNKNTHPAKISKTTATGKFNHSAIQNCINLFHNEESKLTI
jgi:hypothetical protein